MTSASDITADVRKNMRGHWLIRDEYSAFVCENVQHWVPHPTSITAMEVIKENYHVLADGEGCPQIAEHLNTVVTQFPVKACHPETVKILQNFIEHCLRRIGDEGKVGTTLMPAYQDVRLKKKMKQAKIPAKLGTGADLV